MPITFNLTKIIFGCKQGNAIEYFEQISYDQEINHVSHSNSWLRNEKHIPPFRF